MSALAVIGATQITQDMVPLSAKTGGNSTSNPNAGNDAPHNPEEEFEKDPITTADKAGAAILTLIVIGTITGLSIWIIL